MDLVLQSGPIVLAVLLLLVSFSVLSWAIIWTKWKTIGRSAFLSEEFLEVFWSGRSMDHIYSESKKYPHAPTAKIFQAGYKELQKIFERQKQRKEKNEGATDTSQLVPPASTIQNLERSLNMASRNEILKLESSMTFLATTASTAPFIGLFGTVWGIMGAFQNIGAQGGASLAVVAPSIAEALIATAVGLVAAIPASIGYNFFNNKIRNSKIQMENFAGDFLNIVKRNFLSY
ncbi:MAG: protein TolQ [Proteobacteria bacterium]|nr:protein TolQ [Pseudomonadota bacterium]